MTGASLVVENLVAGYRGKTVLHGLSLGTLSPGQVTALVGPNGAGKSTLLQVLAGLLPARGSIRLGGRELLGSPLAERSGRVTFMPQTLPQRVGLTVLEAVISAVRAAPLASDSRMASDQRAMQTLDRLGIADLALTSLDHLSGGERQLASLAQAVVREPDVLLLDEPTSALDLRHQVRVMKLVEELAAEGRVVVLVVHDLDLAARWASQIAVLHRGRLAAMGAPVDTITVEVLARVYGVKATIEPTSNGRPHLVVEDVLAESSDR